MLIFTTRIKSAISRSPYISERVKAVDLLVSSYREITGKSSTITTPTQSIQDLEREMAMSITEPGSGDIVVTAADAQTLIQISEKYGEKYTFEVILPLVKKQTSNVGFTFSFLAELYRAGEADTLRLEVVRNLFKDILGDHIAEIHLQEQEVEREQLWNGSIKRRRLDYDRHGSQTAEDQSPRPCTSKDLAILFRNCERLHLLHEVDQLTNKITSHAPNANSTTFEHLLLPLLKHLPPRVESCSPSIDSHSYNGLLQTILSHYIKICVQPAPRKPTGWERQPRGCNLYCEDCVKLDAFLKDPDKPHAHFSVNGKRRDHIQERVNKGYCWTETVRDGSPYTLVVQKTELEWEKAMKEWKQRCAVAIKAIEDIGLEKLRTLLGQGWEDVVGLVGIKGNGGEEKGARRPLGDLAQGIGKTSAADMGVGKRGRGHIGPEIIDLSGE